MTPFFKVVAMSEQQRVVSLEETVAVPKTFLQRLLDGVETVGNKVPHPAVIFFILSELVGLLIVGVIPKWALLAPIFVPLFMKLGVAPEAVLAAYRVADSPPNVVTPLMPYFALIVVFAQRYDKKAGVGTVIAMMLPYGVAVSVVWILLFLAWELLGIPFGPG